MLCLYGRLKPWDNLMNAHIYPPECVGVQLLPPVECGCGNDTDCNTSPPPEQPEWGLVSFAGDVRTIIIVYPSWIVVRIIPPDLRLLFPRVPNPPDPPTAMDLDEIRRLINPNPTPIYITGGTYHCFPNLRFVIVCLKAYQHSWMYRVGQKNRTLYSCPYLCCPYLC